LTHSKTGVASEVGEIEGLGWAMYHGDNFVLDSLIQGDEAKEEREVKLVNC
jgi:hypothetical protein